MSQFETTLKAGLSQEDQAFLSKLEEDQGLFEQMGQTFTGPLKYWTMLAFAMSFGFFMGAVYGVVQLVNAPDAQTAVLWSTLVLALFLAVSMIKIWFWLRMNHLAVLKELKLTQLMISQSASEPR